MPKNEIENSASGGICGRARWRERYSTSRRCIILLFPPLFLSTPIKSRDRRIRNARVCASRGEPGEIPYFGEIVNRAARSHFVYHTHSHSSENSLEWQQKLSSFFNQVTDNNSWKVEKTTDCKEEKKYDISVIKLLLNSGCILTCRDSKRGWNLHGPTFQTFLKTCSASLHYDFSQLH